MTAPVASALVEAALDAVPSGSWLAQPELRKIPEVQAMTGAPDETRLDCIRELAQRLLDTRDQGLEAVQVFGIVARRKLTIPPEDFGHWLKHSARIGRQGRAGQFWHQMLPHLTREISAWPPDARAQIVALAEPLRTRLGRHEAAFWAVATPDKADPLDLFEDYADQFTQRARAFLASSDEDVAALVEAMATYPHSGKPSARWIKTADEALAGLSAPLVLVEGLLTLLTGLDPTDHGPIGWENERLAVAIPTLAGRLGASVLLPSLRRTATFAIGRPPGEWSDSRSIRLANAAAQAMADIAAPSSITELLTLERAVRHGALLKQIRKAIDTLANAQGLTREELLERAVERHDLADNGTRDVPLQAGTARIVVTDTTVALTYISPEGKPRKSVPAALKEGPDGELLAALRTELKAIRQTIAGERKRLDDHLALDRRWPLAQWAELYLDHPITGALTRRVIWGFRAPNGTTDAIGLPRTAKELVTADGAIAPIPDGAEVRLWHPIDALAEDVAAWRRHLLQAELVQPVKQAFRELYVVTPAEATTRTYSNRFAAHVFRQVQARALMRGRGWTSTPLAWWDDGIDHGVAKRAFVEFGISAHFFFDPIPDVEPSGGDLYPYVTSDQVRFEDADGEVLPLADVPRRVITEALRDVDLFIGVTSIGADPEWLDHGEARQFDTYWQSYSFGDLSAAGQVRRDVLERLLPMLTIRDRCSLDARILTVRGDLREYRIHLGSGNILMSPDDTYLCIVAARSPGASKVFLPFDDDPVLSLVLSKAFLLAADHEITDRTITEQIRR